MVELGSSLREQFNFPSTLSHAIECTNMAAATASEGRPQLCLQPHDLTSFWTNSQTPEMLHDIVSGHHFARSISHVTGTSPASVPDASDAGKGAAVVLHLRSASPPSCTDLPRLQRASAPGDLRLEIACLLLPPTLQCVCVCVRATWPSLLAPRLDLSVLLPHVWQRCTPAHRTGVWAPACPRVEPSGPFTAVRSITVVGKDASRGPFLWSSQSQAPCHR